MIIVYYWLMTAHLCFPVRLDRSFFSSLTLTLTLVVMFYLNDDAVSNAINGIKHFDTMNLHHNMSIE